MAKDRITKLRVVGMRCIKDVSLMPDKLTVLIGENGSGKSTLLEACEILRKAPEKKFLDGVYKIHGGNHGLGVRGPDIAFQVHIEGDGPIVSYFLGLSREGQGLQITHELIQETLEERFPLIRNSAVAASFMNTGGQHQALKTIDNRPLDGSETVLSYLAGRGVPSAFDRLAKALRGIRCHVPFDTTPRWAATAAGVPVQENPMRGSTVIRPATELELLGGNLANAYQALRNDLGPEHWHETLDLIRLGLGERVEDVSIHSDPGGARIALKIKYAGVQEHVSSVSLSDGTLAYLGFVALARLNKDRTLLAFDEPDLHLHPSLLGRVLGLFEAMAKDHPVILATHSDALLDGLEDPAASAVLCTLDKENHTEFKKADPGALASWLESYRGLGDIRSSGNESAVMTEKVTQD